MAQYIWIYPSLAVLWLTKLKSHDLTVSSQQVITGLTCTQGPLPTGCLAPTHCGLALN